MRERFAQLSGLFERLTEWHVLTFRGDQAGVEQVVHEQQRGVLSYLGGECVCCSCDVAGAAPGQERVDRGVGQRLPRQQRAVQGVGRDS